MTSENRLIQLSSSIDYESLADNVSRIAGFTIGKYEDNNDRAFSQDEREKLQAQIEEALMQDIDEVEMKQHEYQKKAFDEASRTLDEVMAIEENRMELKKAISANVLQDNLEDIAAFTIEKYEYKNNCTLPRELSEKIQATIVDVLHQYANLIMTRRRRFLNSLFAKAAKIVDETS